MERTAIFVCFMCFVLGCCLSAFIFICASMPGRKVVFGWMAYLAVVLALAYKLGGALIL